LNIADQLAAAGVGITHHFAGGVYAKETHIPAGTRLAKHSHPSFDHLSALMLGSVVVDVDGKRRLYDAPAMLTIKAGKEHEVTAVTDAVWACIHATEETDPEKVDAGLIA
jgi:quercetin dioxygenase-like cupin family protein